MGHLLGYARVSTTDEHLHVQVDALTAAGCYRVFTETASGTRADRPVLAQVLDQLRPGDTLVVWKLDRLGRSLRHLSDTITSLADRGVGFVRCRAITLSGDNAAQTLRPLTLLTVGGHCEPLLGHVEGTAGEDDVAQAVRRWSPTRNSEVPMPIAQAGASRTLPVSPMNRKASTSTMIPMALTTKNAPTAMAATPSAGR
jgi:Resolvase, N terminal domain